MLITIGNVKGGCGKTTLSVNLAVGLAQRKRDVLLIDSDEQGTAMAFTDLRSTHNPDAPSYTAVALYGKNIRTQVPQLKSRYDDIIIDVGGRNTDSLRAALSITQILLVPAAPRSFDLWGVEQMSEIIQAARVFNDRLVALAVLNGADPSGGDNDAAEASLKELDGIKVLGIRIGRRKAFPNAAARGMSVLEYTDPSNREGSEKAREEFSSLMNHITGGKK